MEKIQEALIQAVQGREAMQTIAAEAADFSPSLEKAAWDADAGLEEVQKAATALLLAREIQHAIQNDSALLVASIEVNGTDFEIDPAQRTIRELGDE